MHRKNLRTSGASRVCLAALLAACLAAIPALSGCSGGMGAAARSVLDRVLPSPSYTAWALSPEPDSYVDSYADATGAGLNYVYLVDAADDEGGVRELQLIFYGAKSSGETWLEVEAKGGSGVHYWPVDESAVPSGAAAALRDGC